MKKIVLLAGVLALVQGASAQGWVRSYRADTIAVTSTRAGENTPMPHSEISGEEIAKQNFGQDMPFLLQITPSVVATSDAGAGIGYTGLRIRGSDATRINVTLDGVPMNDAESHGLFWVNTPDIASSVGSIQVQRGVGTSTNGAGAFGGSVNMLSAQPSQRAFGELAGSYGSFGTHKETFTFGSGLLDGHWTVDGRLSNIHSDGYIDRASTDLKSYMARASYRQRSTFLYFTLTGGTERTYHAWDGVMAKQMKDYGRTYNPCGKIADGVFYADQTDNYKLTNYKLQLLQGLGRGWNLDATLHYYKGDGYYEEYKDKGDVWMEGYLLEGEPTSLVRRKMMDNWFGGGVFSLNYKSSRLEAALGGAANRYDGDHYGRVMWVENYAAPLSPEHRYYNGNGTKDDANIYAKASWEALDNLFVYGDLQMRHINYRITGITDDQIGMNVDEKFNFFNPKGGVLYKLNKNLSAYASVAVAHREPTRNDYTEAPVFDENDKQIMPRAERLLDYEAGMSYNGERLTAGVNFYYMKYNDQLVLTGRTNEIGEPLAENVGDSYRAGVELTAGVRITPWLRWDVNATLSRNRVLDLFDPTAEVTLKSTETSYSPSILAGSLVRANWKNWSGALQTNYVGSQYVTNFEQKALSLDEYCVTNLRVDYTLGRATLGVAVNNLFDARYSSNGYGWDWMENGERVADMFYFPQAGINMLANVTIKF
jgi:iron complex outermembrane receptor protein